MHNEMKKTGNWRTAHWTYTGLKGATKAEEQHHHAGYRRQARGQQCDRLEST